MKTSSLTTHAAGVVAALTLCICTLPAQAGDVVATASRNLQGSISNSSPGSSTSAWWPSETNPDANAISTRTSISATSLGKGMAANNAAAASGTAWTAYTLWNLGADSALDGTAASALDLNLNFSVIGSALLPQVSLSVVTTNYNVEVYSNGVNTNSSGFTGVFGPVPPFPSEDYLFTGNAAFFGNYEMQFSVLHHASGTGNLWMSFGNSAANAGTASGTLSLTSVTLAGGTLPASGVGLRMETGQMFVVSEVPEPQAALLWLTGLVAVTALARRRLAQAHKA